MVSRFSLCCAQKIYCTQFNDRSLNTANIAMRVKSFKMISFKENFVSGKWKSKKIFRQDNMAVISTRLCWQINIQKCYGRMFSWLSWKNKLLRRKSGLPCLVFHCLYLCFLSILSRIELHIRHWCFVMENPSLTTSHYFFQKITVLVQYLDKIIAMHTTLPDRYSSITVAPTSYSEIWS